MIDPIKSFLQNSGLKQPDFSSNSRYAGLDIAEWTKADGNVARYVKRRFIPKPEEFATLQEHLVEEDDRLDNISAKYFNAAELYWRICDANGAMKPANLVEIKGQRIRITLPQGIPEPTEGLV